MAISAMHWKPCLFLQPYLYPEKQAINSILEKRLNIEDNHPLSTNLLSIEKVIS